MSTYIILAVIIAVTGYFFFNRGSSAQAAAEKAAEAGSIAPISEAAGKLPFEKRSKFYQQAILALWNNWQRPLAVHLVKEFAEKHSSEKICQYWLKQVLEVEPLESQKAFDKRFLTAHYRPEVAKSCGLTGS
jgi:hypothetical protein